MNYHLAPSNKYLITLHDLSFKERQAQRELRKEQAARKEKGKTGILICRGCIVKQSKPSNSLPVTVMEHQDMYPKYFITISILVRLIIN